MSKEYASLVYDTSIRHGKYLFGGDLVENVDKQNKEERLMKKIFVDFYERLPPKSDFLYSDKIRPGKRWEPEKHPNQVCQKSCIKEERRSAPETVQSSSEGPNPTLTPVTGHTVFFTDNWKGIQAIHQIPFVEEPSQHFHPSTKANSAEERDLILEEISSLLAKDTIEEVPMGELRYSNNMFLVAKKAGGKRPVLNLRPLNNFVPNETFKMEGIYLLKDFLKHNYFMTKLDMRDAYCSIPVDKQSRCYLQIYFRRKTLSVQGFGVWPFHST